MIKKLLSTFVILIMTSTVVYSANNNPYVAPAVARSIQKYKAGNYVGCIQELQNYFKGQAARQDQLANYYMAMAYTQAGDVNRAKFFYNIAYNVNPSNTIGDYAHKGLVCIEDPANCYVNIVEEKPPEEILTELDKFIRAPYGNGLSADLNKELERKRVEKLRKEMNSDEELNKYEFKDFKKFTTKPVKKSYNLDSLKIAQSVKAFYTEHSLDTIKIASSSNPTDAEIVEALRVLNAAGLTNITKQVEQNSQQTSELNKPEVKSEYKPDLTREQYQQQIQREMMQAQMAQMAQPNIGALFGEKNNNQNDMMNSNMMNMLPFMMAQQAAQNSNGGNQQQMMSPEMMQTMMLNSMMPNMNFGIGGNN